MILADSLQILENEVVQDAISRAHNTGILLGAAIMLVLGIIAIAMISYGHKCEYEQSEKNYAISEYISLKLEMNRIEMLDICKRCIKGDIRISNPVVTLFTEFPTYDAERQAKEMEFFPDIVKQYNDIIKDRTSVVETLGDMIDRDVENVYKRMLNIERKYPEAVAEYLEKHNQQLAKRLNTDKENHETQNNS